jgi:hypothetical protein
VEESKRARWEEVAVRAVAGRGAFGTVLAGTWRRGGGGGPVPVAVKALQPVPPPPGCDVAAHHAYKVPSFEQYEECELYSNAILRYRIHSTVISRYRAFI